MNEFWIVLFWVFWDVVDIGDIFVKKVVYCLVRVCLISLYVEEYFFFNYVVVGNFGVVFYFFG